MKLPSLSTLCFALVALFVAYVTLDVATDTWRGKDGNYYRMTLSGLITVDSEPIEGPIHNALF